MRRGRLLLFVFAICASCRREQEDPNKPSPEEVKRLLAEYEKKKKEEAARQPRPRAAPRPSSAAPIESAIPEQSAEADGRSGSPREARRPQMNRSSTPRAEGPWLADEPVPIAPFAPITATHRGVVLYGREGDVYVAKLRPLSRSPRPVETPVEALPKSGPRFSLGRGPAISADRAHWVTGGRLVRRRFGDSGSAGPLEVLATDARNGTRAAVPRPVRGQKVAPLPPAVAYVVRPAKEDGPLIAKLWVEGGGALTLTPEGSSTQSVSLVHLPDGLLAVSVQARLAMSPVHARRIRFAGKTPLLGEDMVVWVGGSSQSLTELAVLPGEKNELWGFLPHEKTITEFGLARLDITTAPSMDTPTHWVTYPNGLDPAPVDGGYLCGEPVVAFAQPAAPEPDSPQELVVRTLRRGEPAVQSLAQAKAFYDVSFSEVEGGALVAFVADWVTWAVTVRCPKRSK